MFLTDLNDKKEGIGKFHYYICTYVLYYKIFKKLVTQIFFVPKKRFP